MPPHTLTADQSIAQRWRLILAATPIQKALVDPSAPADPVVAWAVGPADPTAGLPLGPALYLMLDAAYRPRYCGRTTQSLRARLRGHRRTRPTEAALWRWALAVAVRHEAQPVARAEEWMRAALTPPGNKIRAAGWAHPRQ